MGKDQRRQRPEQERLAAAVLGVDRPERRARQVGQRGGAGVQQIDDRQRQQHPGQREPPRVAGNVVGLGDEGDGRADGQHPKGADAFAPRGRILAGEENPTRQDLGNGERSEGQRGAHGAGHVRPVMGQQQDDAESHKGAAQDSENRQRPIAARARHRFVAEAEPFGGAAVDHALVQQRRQFAQQPSDLFLRHGKPRVVPLCRPYSPFSRRGTRPKGFARRKEAAPFARSRAPGRREGWTGG